MKAKGNSASQSQASTLNALLKLAANDFSLAGLSRLLSHDLEPVSSSLDSDFASFLAGLARCYSRIHSNKTENLSRDSENRKNRIEDLLPYLESFCTKFGLDKSLALVGLCLRQGDFFILEDEAQFLTTLLPSSRVRRVAMSLCGILTLPVRFQRKFMEYPEHFEDSLSFESACESLCTTLKINPIVPRLATLDEEALKLVETRFGFSRKAMVWFIVTLTNLPLFVLEGLALREMKKMVYLKELEYELQLTDPHAPPPDPDYYDSLDFSDKLYDKPKDLVNLPVSLSHLNELFEVLLFNNNDYSKMDYSYITSKDIRMGSYAVNDTRVQELFGTKDEYYREMAKTFYHHPEDPSIWNDKQELNLTISWLNAGDRKNKKNIWEEMKKLLKKLSDDTSIINGEKGKYGKITLGQLVLFTTLLKIRQRIGSNYGAKLNEQQYEIYCVELELLGVLFEGQAMIHGALGEEYSRIRLYKVLSLALNAFVPNMWDYMVTPSLYESEIYFPMKERFETEKETKAALEYCRNFVEKICSGTNLKLLHYLSFQELIVFLDKPSDALDAESVAKSITPYQKLATSNPLAGDKELFMYDPSPTDIIMSTIDLKLIQSRKTGLVKPRDLTTKKLEGKSVDSISSQPCVKVVEFMKMIDTAFVVEGEKWDLLLDLAVMNWNVYEALQDVLKKAGYILSEKSASLYKAITGVVGKKDLESFTESLEALISGVVCRRDVPGVKNAILLAHGMLSKKENAKVFSNMSYELAEAIKASEYPKGLIDLKYLDKEPLPDPPKEVLSNPYYTKVLCAQDEVLSLHNQGLNDDDAVVIAEALKRNGNISGVDLHSNKIGEKGISAIAEALEHNTAITYLNLAWGNDIEDAGIIPLARALKNNTTLAHLKLSDTGIGDQGAICLADCLIANSGLEILDLYSNKIGDEGAKALANTLTHNSKLEKLYLRTYIIMKANKIDNNIMGEIGGLAIIEALDKNKTIKNVFLTTTGKVAGKDSRVIRF